MSIKDEKILLSSGNHSTTSDAQVESNSSTAANDTQSSFIVERITKLEGPVAITENLIKSVPTKESEELKTSSSERQQVSSFSSHRLDSNKKLDDAISYVMNKRFDVLRQLAE